MDFCFRDTLSTSHFLSTSFESENIGYPTRLRTYYISKTFKTDFQFRKKTLGYDKINVTATKTLDSLFNNLQSTAKWYPGEGEPVIDFLMSVTTFLQTSHNLDDLDQASVNFDNILSMLMKNDSIVSEKVCINSEKKCIFAPSNNNVTLSNVRCKYNGAIAH